MQKFQLTALPLKGFYIKNLVRAIIFSPDLHILVYKFTDTTTIMHSYKLFNMDFFFYFKQSFFFIKI